MMNTITRRHFVMQFKGIRKCFLLKILFIFLSLMVASCCENVCQKIQDNSIRLSPPPYGCFHQVRGNEINPAKYVTCNENDEFHCENYDLDGVSLKDEI